MPVVKADGTLVLALVRGDDRLEEAKLWTALGSDYRPATDDEIRAAFGADGGSLGPVGVTVEIVADETLREGQFVAGANRNGWHLRGVEHGRDFEARFADLRQREGGRRAARAAAAAALPDRDRGRPHLQVRHVLLEPLGATFLDEDGTEQPLDRRQLRHRPGPGDGRGRRAAPRRERDRLAARRSRRTTCTWSRCPGAEELRGARASASRRRRGRPPGRPGRCARARSSPTPT